MTRLGSGPLTAFLAALGARPEAAETGERLNLSIAIAGQAVRDLDFAAVGDLLDSYGAALAAEFTLADLPELEIRPGLTAELFEEKRANFASGDSYDLRLRIDKRILLDTVLGPDTARGSVHYFFATSVEGLLARGLDELERAVWAGATEPRRLLIGDTDLQRSGAAFQVIGGTSLTGRLAALPPLPEQTRAAIERMRSDREEQISWDYQWVQQLTPVQLQLDGEPGSSRLEALLAARYIQLCLLYTCDRARRRRGADGGWQIQPEYQGGQVTVRVPVTEAGPVPVPATGTVTRGFADLIYWCYRLRDEGTTRDWAPDRLQFIQVRIAQVLEHVPEPGRLDALVGRVSDVLAALDDQWRAFIDDRFTQYLDKERQLESAVNDVISTFGDKTTELAKGLSDTLLAAVAVLIGSAIAAAFIKPFDAALFRVGVLAYAGYVLIFPGLYGLGSQVGQFLQINGSFDHERRRFDSLLSPEKTSQIAEDRVTHARKRYWRWFGYTVAGYAIAIGAAIVAAIIVPSIVK